jgi:hypothetical protein
MAKPLQKIVQYIGQHGIVRPRDIQAIGLPREYLVRLHRQRGSVGRDSEFTHCPRQRSERYSYAEVTKSVGSSGKPQTGSSRDRKTRLELL